MAEPFSQYQALRAQCPVMYKVALLLALSVATAAHAEDAEHRADRLRTIELNERAKALTDRRDRNLGRATHDGRATRDYDAARLRYQRELDEWRRQVAACREGDYSACDR